MEIPITVRKGSKYLGILILAATLILILLAIFSFALSPDISFHLTIFTLNSFLTSLITLFFGLFVYFENPKRIENQTWLLFSVTIMIWSFGFGQMVSSETHDAARFWAKINHIGTIFIPATSLHFVLAFLGRLTSQNKKILAAVYTLSGIFELLSFSNLLYEVKPSFFFRFYTGEIIPPVRVDVRIFVSMCIYELLRGYRSTSGIKRNQILYILLAFIVSYGGWVINFLPALDLQIFPFGHYLVPLYMAFVGYAIIKYRLMDISVVINKGAAYIALVGLIFIPAYMSFLLTHWPTVYSIPPLISATIILSCGLWILLNNPSAVTNRTLCLVCVATSIWLFGDFLGHYHETANVWGRIANIGVVYLPAFFYHFVVSFLKVDNARRLVITNYLISTTFLCLIPTAYFFNGEYAYYWGRYIKAGSLHPFFLAYFFILSWVALKKLYSGYKAMLKRDALEAIRIKYVLWAFVIAYPASTDYFQNYGWEFYPIGFLFITFWALIVSYAIVKYQLMEIRFTAARLWTFTRLLILIPLYVVILLLERYFYGSTDYLFAVALLAIFILGAGVIYNAKRQVEEAIAQTFFKKDYQSGVTLKSFSNEMMTILDHNELTYKIVENLSAAMELKRISLFVQDEKGDYVLAADCPERLGRGTEHEKKIIRAENDRAFFSWLEQQERVIELEEIEYESQYEAIRPIARRYFSDVQAKICLPLAHQRKLIGIINLGEKADQKPFTHLDIEFLSSFRGQAISALYNALVHHGVQQMSQELEHMVELRTRELSERTQEFLLAKSRLMEMELIATSSGTLVHAIKNPLLIIQTYVKLVNSAIDTMNYPRAKEGLDQIHRSSNTISRILQGLRRAHIDPAQKVVLRLPEVLEACERDVLGDQCHSQYQIIKRYDVDTPIEGDQHQLRMAFTNLFINALEAMPQGGQVIFRTYESEGGVCVSISDSGSGIEDKMVPNLFRPFFTTKESGTGLGLWTAKRIIEINHAGNLKVESEAGGEPARLLGFRSPTRSEIPNSRKHSMNTGDILVVEDDPRFLKLYRDVLETAGYTATLKKDPESGIQALKTKFPDLVLLDLTFNGADQGGMDFIVEALRYKPDISIIVISAHDESSTIMKAMDLGAVDYIVKDQSLYEFLPIRVGQTLKRTRLEKQIRSQWELHHGFAFGSEKIIIGKSPQMFQVFQLIEQAAASRSTTLIIGESGTGKELVAQAIHARKGQLSGPFVSIDCGAIPKTVLESELFGVRAKYPGFHNADRLVGKFEAAEDGTILLDEIGNMEVDLQAKLLRVLEERQFSPLGAPQPTHLRAQVVASTNIRFDEAIQSGRFREDVYYRLNNIQIVVPPLRDRKEDIPLLVQYFLDRFKRQSGNSTEILPEALEKLVAHDWPGNVRELSRVMQRALTANQSRYLIPKNFDFNSASGIKSEVVGEQQAYIPTKNAGVSYKILVREYQKSILVSALKENDWNQTKAAEQLQISRTYLLMLLKNLKISGPKPETF